MGTCAHRGREKYSHNPLINLRIVYGRQCVWGTCKEILDSAVNFLKDISCCPTLGYAIPLLSAHNSLSYPTPHPVQLRHTPH